jgi:hypothetical protein
MTATTLTTPDVPDSAGTQAPPTPAGETIPGVEAAAHFRSRSTRTAMGILLALVAAGVGVIMLAPVALSSRDLLDWAAAPTGLHLPGRWPALVILALDAPAIACVLMSVLCTWRGERPGLFGLLIWAFAAGSAFANWRHASAPGSPHRTRRGSSPP